MLLPLRKTEARRGAAIVEFAIVGSVLFVIILGLIEVGRGYMVKHELTDAARVGCRVGVVEGKTTSDIQSAVSSYLNTLSLQSASTTVLLNGFQADVTAANPEDAITVVVSVPTNKVTWVPGGKYLTPGGSITGRFTMRRE